MCTNADLFDINGKNKLSEECVAEREEIIRYHAKNPKAAFYLGHSAGKDSQAAYAIVKRLVPAERIFVVHATLGSVEHENVIEHIESNTQHPVHVVRNEKKTFVDMVLLRGMFPSPKYRQCTSDLKTSPIDKFIRAHMKDNGFNIGFNVTGLRSEESTKRALKNPLWINKRLTLESGARTVFDWMPAFHLTESEVFQTIYNNGQKPHRVYGDRGLGGTKGNDRMSCRYCIMASLNDLFRAATETEEGYDHYHELIAVERITDHTMFGRTKTIHTDRELAKGTPLQGGIIIKSEKNTSKRAVIPFKNKVFYKVSLAEKTGVTFDELRVQAHVIRLTKRLAELKENIRLEAAEKAQAKAEKAKKVGSKSTKRDDSTIDFLAA